MEPTKVAGESWADGQGAWFHQAVAAILTGQGRIAGAGFLVGPGLLVTCAHVVDKAGYGPGDTVRVVFPGIPGTVGAEGLVLSDLWRAPDAEDVAFLRLDGTWDLMPVLKVATAENCRGHRVSSYGFPSRARPDGHFGCGEAGHLLPATRGVGTLLQLTGANDITQGFSGGPVVDDVTGLVIGMVSAITASDEFGRNLGIVYVTPTQVLREVHPELAERALSPFRRLEPFTGEHAALFHGRAHAQKAVTDALAEHRRTLLLLGPSGSGKSSLVQAGVLPALARGAVSGSDRWLPVLIPRPGPDLLAELERHGLPGAAADGVEAAARRVVEQSSCERLLLVVDQFEELFVHLTAPASPRSGSPHPSSGHSTVQAIEQLTRLTQSRAPITVLLVMRDDFYAPLAAHAPALAAAPKVDIPATLTQRELRAIIEGPVEEAGGGIEDGLTERIVSDVLAVAEPIFPRTGAADSAGHAGASQARTAPVTQLAALELALYQLWERRTDGRLTHRAYERIGTVSGALATWCADAFDQLPVEGHDVARRILTALVLPGDRHHGTPAARRQVPLATLYELVAEAGDSPEDPSARRTIDAVLTALTRHRIITMHARHDASGVRAPVVELIHDSLIRDWHELSAWVARDEGFYSWLHRAEQQKARWAGQRKKAGDLLHGSELAAGVEWSRQRRLPAEISLFVRSSHRRSRLRTRILAGALTLTLLAAGLFVRQWHSTAASERRAVSAQQQALSRQLAAQSANLLGTDPDLASLLAVYAYRTSPTSEAATSLRTAAVSPLLHTLRQTAGVNSAVFSSDGRTVATASDDDSARLWDATTGRLRHTLRHTADVRSVTFSSDGRTVATASDDDSARLWDATTGRLRYTLRHTADVHSVTFSPNGRIVATTTSRPIPTGAGFVAGPTVQLWDIATGRLLHTLRHKGGVNSVVFSSDGRTVTSAAGDSRARTWNVSTGRLEYDLTDSAYGVLSPDGRVLATADFDPMGHLDHHTTRLRGAATGRTLYTLRGSNPTFSPDGRTVATSDADTVWLWNAATGRRLHTVRGSNATFSPDGRTLATTAEDATWLWSVTTGRTLSSLSSSDRVEFSPNSQTLATIDLNDDTARLWDVTTGSLLRTVNHTDRVTSAVFTPDSRTLATASEDGTTRLWDVSSNRPLHTFRDSGGATFSPDAQFLVSGGLDDTVRLWDAATGQILHTLKPKTFVNQVVLSPDARTLAAGGLDDWVRVWDTTTGRQLHTLRGSNDPAFSPDGRTIATTDDETAQLWDIPTGRPGHTFHHTAALQSVLFSPDGQTLATTGDDDTTQLWDATVGPHLHTLRGSNDPAFSPDGRTIATTDDDGTTRLWDSTTGRPRHTLHQTAHVYGVTFSPDSQTLATTGDDDTIRLWDATTGRTLHTIHEVQDVIFSHDSRTLATTGHDGLVQLRDTATGRRLRTIHHAGSVTSVVFSPDNRTLATAGGHSAQLWDITTGFLLHTFRHSSLVQEVAFRPDGRILTTAAIDSTTQVWEADLPGPSQAITRICRAVARNLTPDEWSAYAPKSSSSRVCTDDGGSSS
ncbi:trypsin-like peptidase domain-containing protein [Streptomyces massasporeus]|uniref:nSTAND1 domain-containing NTPase n=1 Tax=Streptomyces massasporeus TaxID=67324 RepID=UPI0038123BCC